MKPFKDIFSWDGDNTVRELLIEIEGWYLYRYYNDLYYAHGCDNNTGGEIWSGDLSCKHCREKISIGVEAVGILYNWGME